MLTGACASSLCEELVAEDLDPLQLSKDQRLALLNMLLHWMEAITLQNLSPIATTTVMNDC